MEYTPTEWEDRVVENPLTYTMVENEDGTITLTPAPGSITAEGTKINAQRLNNIENGINECVNEINNSKSFTVVTDDVILGNDIDNTGYNELTTQGLYYLTNNEAILLVMNYNETIIIQLVIGVSDSDNDSFYIYERKYNNGSWSPYWRSMMGGIG